MKRRLLSVLLVLCASLTLISASVGAASISYSGSANEPIVYDFIVNEMGLNTAAACGIMANIQSESNFIPTIGTSHYGLCQWSATRTSNMKKYCAENGYDYTTVIGQMHFLEYELQTLVPETYTCLCNVPNTAEGAYTAAYEFCYNFEIPSSKETSSVKRGNIAKEFFAAYSSIAQDGNYNTNSNTTYTAYATTANVNYRTGPGTSYKIVGTVSSGTTVMVEDSYSSSANGHIWYRVQIDGISYYMASEYLTTIAGATNTTDSSNTGDPGFWQKDDQWFYYDENGNSVTSIVQDLSGEVYGTGTPTWWYVEKSEVKHDYTGLAQNEYGWWYMENGTCYFNYTGLVQNDYGWWYIENSHCNFNYTGLTQNDYGWWYIKNSRCNFNYTGLTQNDYGWWYIENSRCNFNYTGLAQNEYGWWYIENSHCNFNYTGLVENENGTWNVINSKAISCK